MRLVKFRNSCAAVVALVVLSAHPAAAEEPVETSIKAWIAAIDASPDWRATYGGLTVDPTSGRATLAGLSVESETPGFSLTFGSIAINGFRATYDDTFAAKSIDLVGGEIRAGILSVLATSATLTAPVLPTTGGFAWDDARPFVAMVKALAPLARVKMERASAGTIVVTETLQSVTTRTTYDQVKLDGWNGAKIRAISAGPLRTDSPAVDPLVTLAARSAETRDIDLDAFLAVYDPDRYIGGVGDRVWHTAVGRAVYRDVAITHAGITLNIGGASLEDFKVRQPKAPPLEAPADQPPMTGAAAVLHQLELLSAYGVGRFAIRDLDIKLTDRDKLHLGGLSFADLSTDAIGAFAIDDMEASGAGQGTVKIGRFGFGGLALPPIETLKAAVAAYEAGSDIDTSSLIPPLSFVEAAGIDVAIATLPAVQLGRFRVDLGRYVGKVPTTIVADLAGADFPATMIPSDRARGLLGTFGYDRVRLDGGVKIDWSPSGEIAVKEFRLAMKDVGGLSGDADLTGLTPADAEHMADPTAALDKLTLKRAAITFTDDSVVGRVIGAQAERLKVDPVKFREQFANGLPFMLTFLGDRALQAQLTPVLQTFVKTGGSIAATVAPSAPLALSALALAAQTSPFSLFGLLSATITGTAGTAPAPPPANDIRKSIEPAN